MMKRIFILLLVLIGLVPAQAQNEATWTAWLYEAATGQMTRVNAAGETQSFTLPLPPGFDQYPNQIAVGHHGSPFAYIVYNSVSFQAQLVVSSSESILGTFNLPLTISDTFEFNASEDVFNDDNTALAFGYSLDGGGWAIAVMDTQTGAASTSLHSDDPLLVMLGVPADYGLTPVVRRFAGREVTFTLVPTGTEASTNYGSYVWGLHDNSLTITSAFLSLYSDTFFATGTTVLAVYDERLANQADQFPMFQANALHVYDPALGARFPFYNAPGETLFSPRFIQNGELVLVNATPPDSTSGQWRVLRRDGNVVGTLPSTVTINDVAGVPDGFIYTTTTFTPGATTLVYVNTRDGLDAGVPVWTSAPNAEPIIAWAGGTETVMALAQTVLPAWAQLAEPIYAPGAVPLPTPVSAQVSPGQLQNATPVVTGFLAVGRLATVNTTQGDQLNMRFGPGTSFEIVGKLPAGVLVTLLDGPRFAEGLTWWKIRSTSGLEGWAVESVNDSGNQIQTLIPGP